VALIEGDAMTTKEKMTVWVVFLGLAFLAGCAPTGKSARLSYLSQEEADWIRSGEPVTFEGESWYPEDNVDILLDSEVYGVGEYRGILLFVDKVDVRPYHRLYTRFSKNKFRSFKRRTD
jgi:hypothetical protein